MNRATWLQDRRMLKFRDVLGRWERRELSMMEAEAFVDEVLVRTLGVREVVVGFNHTFGAGARGTAALLLELGRIRGFVTHVLPPLQVDGLTVSSSTIREALKEGDVELARALLGRPYSVSGTVPTTS